MGDAQGELDTAHELEGKWRALAHDAAIRTEEPRLELDVIQDAALAAVNAVSPMGANLEESFRALPTRVKAVVTHGIYHGAAMALAVTQLRSSLDLNQVEPWFPPKSLWDDIDKMVGEFTEVDEAVVAVVHVVDIISDAPDGE